MGYDLQMGLIYADVELVNPRDASIAPMHIRALADTGALHLCIPEHVQIQLQLAESGRREVTTADGKRHDCPYVGPVEVLFGNRNCFVGAFVIGDETLLGAIPMEDMNLVVDPSRQRVGVHPDSPNMPASIAK